MDETVWHRCQPLLPHLTINGSWTDPYGQVWRRRVNGRWEYQQDEETQDEIESRIW